MLQIYSFYLNFIIFRPFFCTFSLFLCNFLPYFIKKHEPSPISTCLLHRSLLAQPNKTLKNHPEGESFVIFTKTLTKAAIERVQSHARMSFVEREPARASLKRVFPRNQLSPCQ
jgi:hypothetical protein